MPAPSPITKPLRFLSNGIEAAFGSLLLLNAVKAANPAIPISQIVASEPPAKMTSE